MFNGSYSGSDKVQISIEGGNSADLKMDKHLYGIRLLAVKKALDVHIINYKTL